MDLIGIMFLVVGIPITVLTAIYAHSTFLYARGDIAQQDGKLDLAERRFRKAAKSINPIGRGATMTALARVLIRDDRPDEAIEFLRQAATKTKVPSIVLAIFQLLVDASLHPKVGRSTSELLAEIEQLLGATRMPSTLRAMLLGQFAHAWSQTGNDTEARRLIDLALETDRLNAGALFNGGWLSLREGDLKGAKDSFNRLLGVREKDQRPLGLYGLGTVAFYAGELDEADRLYRRALAEGSPLLEPFVASRQAMVYHLLGKDAVGMIRRAEEGAEKLRKRKTLGEHSSVDWLIAGALAWVNNDAGRARESISLAPRTAKAEAAALAEAVLRSGAATEWKFKLPARV